MSQNHDLLHVGMFRCNHHAAEELNLKSEFLSRPEVYYQGMTAT